MPENITNIQEAPSKKFDNHVESALVISNQSAAETQSAPEQSPAGIRLTKLGKRVVAAAVGFGLSASAAVGVHAAKEISESSQAEHETSTLNTLQDYQESGELPEGKVAIVPGAEGTAYDLSQSITSGEDTAGLQRDILVQADAQGYPGVESNEVYVVDKQDVDPNVLPDIVK